MTTPITEAVKPHTAPSRLLFHYGWVNLVIAALAMVATFPGRTFGLSMINLPLQRDLHIGDVFQGWLNFWSVLLGAAFCLPVGRLLDRFGARLVLTVIVASLGGVVLWMSTVQQPAELFVSLTLTRGLGQGGVVAGEPGAGRQVVPPAHRAGDGSLCRAAVDRLHGSDCGNR
jgi:MFS family permease